MVYDSSWFDTWYPITYGTVGVGAIGHERVGSASPDPLVHYGTNPQVPNLGYYESNSGSQTAGDTTRGSLDLPF